MASSTTSSLARLSSFRLPTQSIINSSRRRALWADYDALFQGSRGALARQRRPKTTAAKGADKPLVLEKPLRFNPPSHGSRLPSKQHVPRHYGPVLTASDIAAQSRRDYPGMMPPEGTWAHWFWTSRGIHIFISVGTLFTLAVATFAINLSQTSPHKDLLPPASDFWRHPLRFLGDWFRVVMLTERDRGRHVAEERRRDLDDVEKRKLYRSVHGLDEKAWINNVFGGADKSAAAATTTTTKTTTQYEGKASTEENAVATVAAAAPESHAAEDGAVPQVVEKPRKRFGIF